MSNAVTALNGAASREGIATIVEVPAQGMITLRGDLGSAGVKAAATSVAPVDFPQQGQARCVDDTGICWMSPDEALVLCPYDQVGAHLETIKAKLGDGHALAVDVSDARAVFDVSGAAARDVMAKLVPVDLAPDVFGQGMFRRTRMAQVPVAFWLHDTDIFRIVCFRSQARYVFDLLKVAAKPGSRVNMF